MEDVVAGCVAAAGNVARAAALLAGLPETTAGSTINRFCSSGLQRHRHGRALHHRRRRADRGRRRRRVHQLPGRRRRRQGTAASTEMYPDLWMPMIDTADIVAERYKVSPRIPGRIFAGIPAPHGRRPAGRQVQGRDRPRQHQDEGGRQGDEGGKHRRLHGRSRRVQSARHDARGPGQARAGERSRASSSPPATPASSPTAPPPWC